ncbi:hypothetical protein MJO28_009914 [Puccinia striiformis f. sp. tritici]|uniref:Uncharacterized protein n=4 Tax=Puccinia striiformis TaxID=27350 RepID=A0A0L0VNE5_9BASI|nr:hypothetical protein Pst134EA_017251 [Puccinia striiformis f. sp. tritici]KAI9622507.1 hypothetical protein H4Q26_015188 [Puccinia striiformis f. sp. tritici PST-130]KNF00732.1 hypothetical protein PSTG_06146 [Puccinia striiformis f. sp. tritici PST-78]POV97073.1 hypothetical protein PSHT_14753 [Puccinia striiformis]KAH9450652.1 hypothetical protein Pst134EB_018180 [Puccinia striiformis f. sp. tritici]KAH9460941.1 hypothetical protein Pst134EA_017251 [Puccinia striiformis f. sp. tritici]
MTSIPVQLSEVDARKKAAMELTIEERLSKARSFADSYGQQTSGIVEFIEYLVSSGRIAEKGGGSQWWRGVNGLLILDLIDAQEALKQPISTTDSYNSPAVQYWIDYSLYWQEHRTSLIPLYLYKAQKLWWKAHQTSLHFGIHAFPGLLLLEPEMEIKFITTICVPNVDLTGLLSVPTNLMLIKLYTILAYPDHYPTQKLSFSKALLFAPAFYLRIVGATSDVLNIGLDSTRWGTAS